MGGYGYGYGIVETTAMPPKEETTAMPETTYYTSEYSHSGGHYYYAPCPDENKYVVTKDEMMGPYNMVCSTCFSLLQKITWAQMLGEGDLTDMCADDGPVDAFATD